MSRVFRQVAQAGTKIGERPTKSTGIAIRTPTPSTPEATGAQGQNIDTTSLLPQPSPYAFTLTNIMRLVKRVDQQEKQIKLFVEQPGPVC